MVLSLSSFTELCNGIDATTFKDDSERLQALEQTRNMARRLETPMDVIMRMTWTEPCSMLAARIALDMDLFSKLGADESAPKTATELAEPSGMDPALAARVLRHLAAVGMVEEIGPETYAARNLSVALTKPEINGGFDFLFDVMFPSFTKLPEYLENTGYKNPIGTPGPWQYASQQDLPLFEWYKQHPKKLQGFQNHMMGYTSDRPGWLDIYPAGELLETKSPLSQDDVLLVDVGGGYGQDLERFRSRYPDATGRLILQEQPEVIEKAIVNPKIELMNYDFFKPQPIEGARAYFLHSVLHGGDDERARQILRVLASAMKKSYSTLLINENVIPATGANPLATSLDLIMMSSQGSEERKEAHWREILESVGFKIIHIHTSVAVESIIEAELA